ncbi:hypothetical protein F5876DRAFT_67913 [Lentinula aff. lateritia]|uniref:Uncharacterized protein n=1 Tax=Lentinula aff. lateritia TaxID=2804960 RepID=A0ACC1TSI0_9AGAR|nr:hypothetical protein F5876DRAFT_67913 [Lentinula aff. lateritia]
MIRCLSFLSQTLHLYILFIIILGVASSPLPRAPPLQTHPSPHGHCGNTSKIRPGVPEISNPSQSIPTDRLGACPLPGELDPIVNLEVKLVRQRGGEVLWSKNVGLGEDWTIFIGDAGLQLKSHKIDKPEVRLEAEQVEFQPQFSEPLGRQPARSLLTKISFDSAEEKKLFLQMLLNDLPPLLNKYKTTECFYHGHYDPALAYLDGVVSLVSYRTDLEKSKVWNSLVRDRAELYVQPHDR